MSIVKLLPPEVWFKIFDHVKDKVQEIIHIRRVSHDFRHLIDGVIANRAGKRRHTPFFEDEESGDDIWQRCSDTIARRKRMRLDTDVPPRHLVLPYFTMYLKMDVLQTLVLSEDFVQDFTLDWLSINCTHVTSFDLPHEVEGTDEMSCFLQRRGATLKSLKMKRWFPKLEDILLLGGCKLLEDLEVSTLSQVTDVALDKLLQLPKLKCLQLDSCWQLTSVGLAHSFLTNSTSSLRSIDLSFLDSITCATMRIILMACPELVSLSIFHCPLFSDNSVRAIAEYCPLLEHLSLCFLPLITSSAVVDIFDTLKKLTHVSLSSLQNVFPEIADFLQLFNPNIRFHVSNLGQVSLMM